VSDGPNIRLQPRRSPEALCGFCRDSFVPEEEVQTCEGCTSPFHLECWRDELGEKCTTLGCNNEKPARGPRRFHALRGRLRRRRRRRLLDGEMGTGSTQGRVFAFGFLAVVAIGLLWAARNLDGTELIGLVAVMIPLTVGAGLIYSLRQRRDPSD
jgi:hypothetical protein